MRLHVNETKICTLAVHCFLSLHLQLVKDVRRLVDNGEFLANRHSNSPVCKLIVTLLLELITDHSREVNKQTKKKDIVHKEYYSLFDSLFTLNVLY